MNIINMKIGDIRPYEKNPRIDDAAVEAVAKSIKEFGFRVPLVLDKNNAIITGHTRLRSAKLLGLTEVPCIIADNLTPDDLFCSFGDIGSSVIRRIFQKKSQCFDFRSLTFGQRMIILFVGRENIKRAGVSK